MVLPPPLLRPQPNAFPAGEAITHRTLITLGELIDFCSTYMEKPTATKNSPIWKWFPNFDISITIRTNCIKIISLLSPPSHLPSYPAAVPFVFPIWVYWSFYNLLLPLFCQRLMDIGSKIEPFRRKMHQKRTFAKVLGQNPIADRFQAATICSPWPAPAKL